MSDKVLSHRLAKHGYRDSSCPFGRAYVCNTCGQCHTIGLDRKRQRALKCLRWVSFCQLIFCPLLLIFGAVGQSLHGDADGGVTYYAGAYLAAALVVFPAITGIVIHYHGRRCFSTPTAAMKLGCLMPTYCIFLALSSLGYIIAVLITGIGGICSSDDCVYKENMSQNKRLAITILVLLLLLLTTNIFGMVLVCFSEKYFGLALFKRGHGRIADSSSPRPREQAREPVVIPRSTVPHPNAHPQIIHNLQVQNQLLQEQVLLNQQQQLNLLHGGPPPLPVRFAAESDVIHEPPQYTGPRRHRKRRRHRGHRTAPEPPADVDNYSLPPIHGMRPQPQAPPPYPHPDMEPPPYTP